MYVRRILWPVALLGLLASIAPAQAAVAPNLGQASAFAVLAGTSVVSIGPSVLGGDVGVYPGAAVSGFPPATQTSGTIHAADATAQQAILDATAAYNALAAQPCSADLTGQDLGGMSLVAGVYCFAASAIITGTLTLDAQGDPNAVFVFKTGSTLGSAVGASVKVINGGSDCNVFWQIGSSSTLGTATSLAGNVIALVSITLNTGASVSGRVVARNGTVSLDTSAVAPCPSCGTIALSPAGLAAAEVGVAYSQGLSAGGGTAPYAYGVVSGTLPPGLALTGSGALAGTPTLANSYTFSVQATDASNCTGSQSYTLLVNPSGGSSGDPHLRTLDGLAYDFQACGDFVLLTSPKREFELQVRQKPWGANRLISINTQVAIQHGVHRLVIATIGANCKSTPGLPDACVWADGQAVALACATLDAGPGCARFGQLADGSRIEEQTPGLNLGNCGASPPLSACVVSYAVRLTKGETVTICVQKGYLNVRAAVPNAHPPISGLLGNADGNPSNDLQLRGGGQIPLVPTPNYPAFYATFGESWRVPLAESLLGPDADPAVICGSTPFTTADLDDQSRNHAAQTCASVGVAPESVEACTIDAAVLGDSAALAFVGLAAPRKVLSFQKSAAGARPGSASGNCGDLCGIDGGETSPAGCSLGSGAGGIAGLIPLSLLGLAWLVIRWRRRMS